jgi:hypothetical protein
LLSWQQAAAAPASLWQFDVSLTVTSMMLLHISTAEFMAATANVY